METEIKDALDELGRSFEEFKDANDQRLAEIAKKGVADPLTEEKVNKLNGRLDQIETALRRTGTGAPADSNEPTPEAKAFFAPGGYLRRGTEQMEPDFRKALTVGDDTQAGYLAPAEFVNEIIKGAVEFSPIRSVARVRTTSRRAVELPKRTGTFSAQWTSESGTRSETTGLTYGLEEIPTHELYALVDVSNQMLEDSAFNLEQELEQEFSEQFGVAEGAAFVTGNGAGRPEGILDNANVGETVSGSASTIADASGQANGLVDLYHAIKSVYALNGTWVLNRSTLGAVRKLKDGNNNYIWQPGIAGLRPSTILDAPFVEATDMPNEAANAFPIVFGDFRRAYTIIDRIQLSVLRDPFTQATAGNTRFIARRRVGGQVVLAEAIRKLKVSA